MAPSPTAVFRANANALITGAASGIGLAVAKLAASHSMNLILVDNNESQLDEAKTAISASSKGTVHAYTMDVSNQQEWTKLRPIVEEQLKGGKLDFLLLNAAISFKSDWTDSDYFRKIFDVNLFGIIYGINTFYPHFDGNTGDAKAIICTGSKQGITNPPGNPAYNATKSAVKTITEHLSFDLAKTSPSTSVHLLVPGWTFTGITRSGGVTEKPAGAWAPEQVADFLYQKMGEGKFYAICPDNDVTWEQDRKRMMWTQGDIVYERPPQSRWREDFKDEANKTMEGMKLGAKQAGSTD